MKRSDQVHLPQPMSHALIGADGVAAFSLRNAVEPEAVLNIRSHDSHRGTKMQAVSDFFTQSSSPLSAG